MWPHPTRQIDDGRDTLSVAADVDAAPPRPLKRGMADGARRPPARHPAPPRPACHRLREDAPPPHARRRALGQGAGADGRETGRASSRDGGPLYGCYLRVGDLGPWAGPWAGIARLGDAVRHRRRRRAVEAADRDAGWLPGFPSALHRDARAPCEPDADRGPRTGICTGCRGDSRLRPARGARGGARTQPRRTDALIDDEGPHRARRRVDLAPVDRPRGGSPTPHAGRRGGLTDRPGATAT